MLLFFKRFSRRIFFKWWWVLLTIYLIGFCIPNYYRFVAEIPPQEELNISSGEIVLKDTGRRGYKIGLRDKGSTIYFTCRAQVGGNHDSCGRNFSGQDLNKYSGEKAKIQWFKQPIYLFSYQNRIASVSISGTEVLSYVVVKDNMNIESNLMFSTYFSIIAFLIIWSLGVYVNKDV